MQRRRAVLLLAALCGGALAVCAAGTKILNAQYRSSSLRATPSALGGIVASLAYGESVTVVEEKAGWMKVTTKAGKTGWVNAQALSPRTVTVSGAGKAETGASSDEMAMAGKGFSEAVEKEFKSRHADIDFSWVDKMEKWVVAPEQLQGFLKDGKVTPAEGGAR